METKDILKEIREGVLSIKGQYGEVSKRMDAQDENIAALSTTVEELRSAIGENGKRIEAVESKGSGRKVSLPGVEEGENGRKFSFARAVLGIVTRDWSEAGYEKEVFDQTRKKALLAGNDTAGGYIVPVEMIAELIELLRAKTITAQLGVTRLPGLTGSPVYVPRQTGGATAAWIGENTAVTATDQTLGQMELRPHTCAAMTKLSLRLLRLSNPAAEVMVREDLTRVLANAIDIAVIKGTGAGNEPRGVANVTGIGSAVSLATIGTTPITKLQKFVGQVEDANALMGRLGFAMTPATRRVLASLVDGDGRPLFFTPNEGAGMSLPPSNVLLGYPSFYTTAMAAGEIIFGNWSDAILGEWTGLELRATQEAGTAFETLQAWVQAIQEVDVGCRHAASFCRATDLAA